MARRHCATAPLNTDLRRLPCCGACLHFCFTFGHARIGARLWMECRHFSFSHFFISDFVLTGIAALGPDALSMFDATFQVRHSLHTGLDGSTGLRRARTITPISWFLGPGFLLAPRIVHRSSFLGHRFALGQAPIKELSAFHGALGCISTHLNTLNDDRLGLSAALHFAWVCRWCLIRTSLIALSQRCRPDVDTLLWVAASLNTNREGSSGGLFTL